MYDYDDFEINGREGIIMAVRKSRKLKRRAGQQDLAHGLHQGGAQEFLWTEFLQMTTTRSQLISEEGGPGLHSLDQVGAQVSLQIHIYNHQEQR